MEFNHPRYQRRATQRLHEGWRIELLKQEFKQLQHDGCENFSYETVSTLCSYVGANVEHVDRM